MRPSRVPEAQLSVVAAVLAILVAVDDVIAAPGAQAAGIASRRSAEAQLSVESPTRGGSLDHGNEIHSLVRFHT